MTSVPSGSRPAPTFRVLLLGPFALEQDGALVDTTRWQRRVSSLFKLLAVAPGRRRLRDEVVDIFWPDAPPGTGSGSLRIAAHRLRLGLGSGEPTPVVSDQGWIGLNPAYRWDIDIDRFEDLARSAGTDIGGLEQALSLYRGEPLAEERYEDWAGPIRDYLQQTWRQVGLNLADAYSAASRHADAVRCLERVLQSDPLDEEALRRLLEALYNAGKRVEALRRYQQFEQRLAQELEVPPSPETMAVVQRLHARFAEPGAAQIEKVRERPLPIGRFLGALPEGPIVAREEELERILFVADVAEGGAGRMALLGGERGVGKTRLAQEVALRLRDRGFVVATGRCYEGQADVPLYPFGEVMDLLYDAVSPSLRAHIAQGWQLPSQGPSEGGVTVVDRRHGLDPPSDDGDADSPAGVLTPTRAEQQHLARIVTGALIAIAEKRPVALLLDDLHRADAASLDLIQQLARQIAIHPVLLVGTYRDDSVDREHALNRAMRDLAREGLVERIPVRRLTLEETAALIDATMGEMEGSAEFAEFVYRRTRGNPFFIDRMLQALGGRFSLIRQIARGGMGRVFEAVDSTTGDPVAVKILFSRTEADPRALQRFEQEGAILAELDHPNVVGVYGTVLNEFTNSIVMELLDGVSLGRLLSGERLPLPRIQHLALQVTAALECAHEHGIVHRDIKPDNIMVLDGDRVKVTDFGIARLVRPKGSLTTQGSTGITVGTPLYMAPEQIEGQKVDGRADIYSLGAVLYQAVTGRPPFEGDDPLAIAFRHVHEAPTSPSQINPHVPADWEALILRALAKNPAERFQTAAAMGEAIAILGTERSLAQASGDASAALVPPTPPAFPAGVSAIEERREQEASGHSVAERVLGRKRRALLALGGTGVLAAALVAAAGSGLFPGTAHHVSTSPTVTRPKASPVLKRIVLRPTPVVTESATGFRPGQFLGPTSVSVDAHGNTYATDDGNGRVQEFSPKGEFLKQFGSKGSGRRQLSGPTYVALEPDGTMVVADFGNYRIQLIRPNGDFLKPIQRWPGSGGGAQAFNSLAIDRKGLIYATDLYNDHIVELTLQGKWRGQWGRPGKGRRQFEQPTGIAVASDGSIYIADNQNDRIQEFSHQGKFLRAWGRPGSARGQFKNPNGLAVDAAGNVYVADTDNNRIQKFSPDGRFMRVIGRAGSGRGELIKPSGVAVDRQGNIYVSDYYNHRIEKFSPAGKPLWATHGRHPGW